MTFKIMETKKRKYSKSDIVRLVVGHGTWIFLMFRMGEFGFLVGAIIALLTAPKGLYD